MAILEVTRGSICDLGSDPWLYVIFEVNRAWLYSMFEVTRGALCEF